ncbi:hypothetical protein, partial [Vibrio vulnificus]|uniref:hypothetical protein n=1 Tax=Vibrio vulnificus TaxID=672 RepID=UPI0039B4A5D8
FFFIAIPVSLFLMHKFGLFGVIFDKFKVVKEISTKADHASLWGSFALMYDAGLQVRETCRMLSEASGRKDSRESFEVLGRLVNMGWEPHKA